MELTHILIADDHSLIREGIRNLIEANDKMLIVGEAWDGPTLFAKLAETRPDFLLFDVSMPNFDPIESLREIKKTYPALKILVISAHDDEVYVRGLLAAGADGYHMKDLPAKQLIVAIEQILGGQKWIASSLINKLVNPTIEKKSSITLTTRQSDLLHLLTQGLDNQSMALKLDLSVRTVENNLTRLYRILNVQSRLEAVNFAIQNPEVLGLSSPAVKVKQENLDPGIRKEITILLVDDNPRFRRELRQTVNNLFPRAMVYEAENISEAVHLTGHIKPNLILIDMILGKESGIQCTKLLKDKTPTSRIILISAYPDKEFHRLGLEAGAMAFIDKKDMDISSLKQIISDLPV